MKKLIKKIGYGHAVHYNGYRKKFEVYRLGEYSPGTEILKDSKVVLNKDPKKALKKYIKKYITKRKK